ncbi:MAG: DUF4360 domain-containing protein [Micromonosporaceae bacterium]|nr:DUF4360 domain-containing protein [Micromonosporaceae bacterium]
MRKSVIGIGAAMFLAGSVVIGATVVAQAAEDSEAVTQAQPQIELVTALGSGCPSGIPGVSASYSDGIQLTFPEMQSVLASATGTGIVQANCQLSLKVTLPSDVTYAATALRTHAVATLARGATAQIKQTVYVQGVSETSAVDNTITGPVDGDLDLNGTIPAESQSFAPCGVERNLNVNTRIVLNGDGVTSASTVNKVSITRGMTIALALKSC